MQHPAGAGFVVNQAFAWADPFGGLLRKRSSEIEPGPNPSSPCSPNEPIGGRWSSRMRTDVGNDVQKILSF